MVKLPPEMVTSPLEWMASSQQLSLEGTAGNGDLRPGLEALGAGVIGDALTRAARGGHGGGAAADGQSGLCLDAVLARGEFERGAGDDEIAQGGSLSLVERRASPPLVTVMSASLMVRLSLPLMP